MRYLIYRFSRIVILTSIIIFSIQIIAWQIVNLPQITLLLSNQLTSLLKEKYNASISIGSLSFQLFPFGPVAQDITISGRIDPERKIKGFIQSCTIYLAPLDWIMKKNPLSGVKIDDGLIYYDDRSISHSSNKSIEETINDIYANVRNKKNIIKELNLPRINIFIEKVLFYSNILDASIDSIQIQSSKNEVYSKGNIAALKIRSKQEIIPISMINYQLSLARDSFSLQHLRIYKNLSWIGLEGFIPFKATDSFFLKTFGKLELVDSTPFINELDGFVKFHGDAVGFLDNLSSIYANLNIKAKNIKTEIGNSDKANARISLNNKQIYLKKLEYKHKKGKLLLEKSGPILGPLEFSIENMATSSIFTFLKGDLDAFVGNISTKKLVFNIDEEKIHLTFPSGLILDKFKLDLKADDNPFMMIDRLNFSKGGVNIGKTNGVVEIISTISFGNTSLPLHGKIDSKMLDFQSNHAYLNLQDIGKLGDVSLSGEGAVNIRVKGPLSDISFNLNGILSESKLLGLDLGTLEGEFRYGFNTNILDLANINAFKKDTKYSINGMIDFKQEGQIDLYSKIHQSSIAEFFDILGPVLEKTQWIKQEYLGFLSGDLTLQGSLDAASFDIKANINTEKGFLFKEKYEKLNYNLQWKQEKLILTNIQWDKHTPFMNGRILFDSKNLYVEYDLKVRPTHFNHLDFLEQLNIPWDGIINAEFKGSGHLYDHNMLGNLDLKNFRIGEREFSDTNIYLNSKNGEFTLGANLLDDIIKIRAHSNHTLEYEKKKNTDILLEFKTYDLNIFLGMIDEENFLDQSLKGFLHFNSYADFNINDPSTINTILDIQSFHLEKNDYHLNIDKKYSRGEIIDGVIKKWDFVFNGKAGNIQSSGKGNINDIFQISTLGSLNAKYLEIIRPSMDSGKGKIEFKWLINGKDQQTQNIFQAKSEGFNIFDPKSKVLLEKIQFALSINSHQLLLEHFVANLGGGSVTGDGEIAFKFPFPTMKLGFNFKDAKISLFSKNKIIFSGFTKIIGDDLPYKIQGDLNLSKAEFFNEFADYQSSKAAVPTYYRFIPNLELIKSRPVFDLDIKFDTLFPINIKNTLLEMDLVGSGSLNGTIDDIKIIGLFELGPKHGRFFFKNNDFLLKKGEVKFLSDSHEINPTLDFLAVSHISDYDVNLKVTGKAKNIELALNSEPALPEKEIFSLLTLGITNQKSTGLADDERASLVAMELSKGLGSLILEKLNLNKGMESSLGLTFGFNSEIDNDEDAFQKAQNDVGIGKASVRKQSTQSFWIQKELGPKLNVSYLSTFGNTIGRSEMNINYILGPKVNVQGIWEKRTGNTVQETEEGLGVNFKFKWTFK